MENKKNKLLITIFWVTLFSIAMGYLESAIVIYLRELYYPEGFKFPLVPVDNHIAITEVIRELMTMIMLLSIGVIAGKNISERFSFFMLSFAIWDIFYYIFLKLIIDWPESLLTWDILFLVPLTWTGPVITPVIVAFSMILFALCILYFNRFDIRVIISKLEWLILIVGSVSLITAFVWDYCRYITTYFPLSKVLISPFEENVLEISMQYSPVRFNWTLFIISVLIILIGIGLFIKRNYLKLSTKITE